MNYLKLLETMHNHPAVRTWNDIVDISSMMRDKLKELEDLARSYSDLIKDTNFDEWLNQWEVIAQSILAMRHIEDARMKYWKVIQYTTTWTSCYDK